MFFGGVSGALKFRALGGFRGLKFRVLGVLGV